jgi:hypothetical protein
MSKNDSKPRPITKEELPAMIQEHFRVFRTQGEEALRKLILKEIQERRNPVIETESGKN